MVLSQSRHDDGCVPRRSPRNAYAPELLAFGSSIRRCRLAQALSQEELAFMAGVDRSYLSSVECGRQNVGLFAAVRLARALQVSLATLAAQANI